jgi:hypothetical protein
MMKITDEMVDRAFSVYNGFRERLDGSHEASIRAVLEDFASYNPSTGYTLEQIVYAMVKSGHSESYAKESVEEWFTSKPKTPEERVFVAVHLADDDFSGFDVYVDDAVKAQFRDKENADIHRLGWIASLKEADRE